MDAATQEAVDWVLKIAGAAIAILPLVFTVALIKGAKGIIGTVAGRMQGSRAAKGIGSFGERVGDNVSGRRRIRAMSGKGFWGSRAGAGYRMSARSRAVHAGIQDESKRAEREYTDKLAANDSKFRSQVAGGLPALDRLTQGLLGAADPAALQRALAGAKFSIEKAEAEEVKAAHASIDTKTEAQLNDLLEGRSGPQSNAMKAAALERLVRVGGMDSIEKAVDTFGKSGESNIMTKSLANALREDGPGFLKAADLDNIGRGQLGATYTDAEGKTRQVAKNLQQMVGENLAAGVLSPEKMVASSGNELEYASKVASEVAATGAPGSMDGVNNLQDAATKVKANPTLSGKIKNNRSQIDSLEAHGTI